MRRLALVLVSAVLFLSACTAAVNDSEAPSDGDQAHTYGAGDAIAVTLSLKASDDGGRRTPFKDKFRPKVEFAGQELIVCSFGVPAGADEFAPGETGELEITCTEDVTIEPDATDFVVHESGKQIGTGVVHLP